MACSAGCGYGEVDPMAARMPPTVPQAMPNSRLMRMAPKGPEDDGLQITNDTESEVVTYEEVCWDYVHWRDFPALAIPRVAGSPVGWPSC